MQPVPSSTMNLRKRPGLCSHEVMVPRVSTRERERAPPREKVLAVRVREERSKAKSFAWTAMSGFSFSIGRTRREGGTLLHDAL